MYLKFSNEFGSGRRFHPKKNCWKYLTANYFEANVIFFLEIFGDFYKEFLQLLCYFNFTSNIPEMGTEHVGQLQHLQISLVPSLWLWLRHLLQYKKCMHGRMIESRSEHLHLMHKLFNCSGTSTTFI